MTTEPTGAREDGPSPGFTDADAADYAKCECCATSYEQGHSDGYQAGYTQGAKDGDCGAKYRSLRTRIAELEGDAKDAKLGAAIYRACADLPSGWQLCVFLERGAGWVELSDADDVAVDVETNDLPFDQHVTAAIDAALTPPSAGAV